MAQIVSFDPERLLIIENGIGSPEGTADNELNVVEIYSEWKEWAAGGFATNVPALQTTLSEYVPGSGSATFTTTGTITPAGTNRFGIVKVGYFDNSTITQVLWGATDITANVIVNRAHDGANRKRYAWFYILDPPIAPVTVSVTKSAIAGSASIEAECWANVDQTTPYGDLTATAEFAEEGETPATITITSTYGKILTSGWFMWTNGGGTNTGIVHGGEQTATMGHLGDHGGGVDTSAMASARGISDGSTVFSYTVTVTGTGLSPEVADVTRSAIVAISLNGTVGAPTGGLGYPLAMRVVGGDPLTGTLSLGSTFFLLNGWRIKPAEGSHKLTLVGNLFTEPSGQSISVPTDGAYTVNVENRVSSLVDVSIATADLVALQGAVFIDFVNGVSGTADGFGTPTNPVNNLADATVIAANFNLRSFIFRGASIVTLPQAYTQWSFKHEGGGDELVINLNGQNVNGSRFDSVTLTGAQAGHITAYACDIDAVTGLHGTYNQCGFESVSTVTATGSPSPEVNFVFCYSEIPGDSTPAVQFSGPAYLNVRNWSGGIELLGAVAGVVASIDMAQGHLKIGPTNVGGEVLVRGVGRLTDTRGSPQCVLVKDGLMEASDLRLIRQVMTNKMHTDPSTGKLVIYDDDDSTILRQADLFEDIAGAQPYRGRGADRRERLT